MTIYNFPSGIRIVGSKFQLQSNVQIFQSPLSNSTQRILLPGAVWTVTYNIGPHTQAEFAPMKAFFMHMQGGYNTFYGFDPDCITPRGVATGTPLVRGGSQTGLALVTDGWTPNVFGILKQGDYIQVGNEMKMVMADCDSDGGGIATIPISHPFRVSPTDNAPIITNKASCVMRLADVGQDSWDADMNGIITCTFSAVETFFG